MGLTEPQTQIVLSVFTRQVRLAPGEWFVREGDVVAGIGFLTQGMCRYSYNTSEGEEITRWVTLESNFVTSLSSFIRGGPAPETIQAIGPAAMLMASRADWNCLMAEHDFVRRLWSHSMEELYLGMENRVYQLIALNAVERYQWMTEHQPGFIEHVPDKYVASMLGITPRHLSRLRNSHR